MGDFSQIAQDGHRVCAIRVLAAEFCQCPPCIAAQDHIEQVQHATAVRKAQHCAHLGCRGFASAVTDRLIQQRCRIARRPFGRAGNQGQRVICNLCVLGTGYFAQEGNHNLGFNPPQIKALATRQDCHGHFADFGGGKDEFDVFGRLLQRFQKGVERPGRQHVHFVDDIDFVAGRRGTVVDRVDNFANVGNTGV